MGNRISIGWLHEFRHSLVVTNTFGVATSRGARLGLTWPVGIVEPPQPQTVVVGEEATFTVIMRKGRSPSLLLKGSRKSARNARMQQS